MTCTKFLSLICISEWITVVCILETGHTIIRINYLVVAIWMAYLALGVYMIKWGYFHFNEMPNKSRNWNILSTLKEQIALGLLKLWSEVVPDYLQNEYQLPVNSHDFTLIYIKSYIFSFV